MGFQSSLASNRRLDGQKSAAGFELQAVPIRQQAHLQVAASIDSFQTKKKVT
jgi:hypothetical protein